MATSGTLSRLPHVGEEDEADSYADDDSDDSSSVTGTTTKFPHVLRTVMFSFFIARSSAWYTSIRHHARRRFGLR